MASSSDHHNDRLVFTKVAIFLTTWATISYSGKTMVFEIRSLYVPRLLWTVLRTLDS